MSDEEDNALSELVSSAEDFQAVATAPADHHRRLMKAIAEVRRLFGYDDADANMELDMRATDMMNDILGGRHEQS